MFDSRQYEFADITLILGGRDITGIRAINYGEKVEREALFAKGRFAHSIQTGNVAYAGEITCLQSELEAILAAGKGSLARLKGMQATCTYGDPSTGDAMITDSIVGIYFEEYKKEMKQGDKFMEVKLPFLAIQVIPQVK